MKNEYYSKRKMVLSCIWIVLGAVIWGLAFADKIPADLWSGIGAVLMLIGALQLYRNLKYHRDPEYKKKIDIEASDERNSFIRMKAWAWISGRISCC